MATPHYTISWDEALRPDFSAPERQLYRETVHSVAQRAKAAMDTTLHTRIEKAQAIVLAGDITVHEDGTATIASQSDGSTKYHVNGLCDCRDAAKALDNWCKHRLALGIAKRVTQAIAIAEERMASEEPHDETPVIESAQTPMAMHTEAPASVNVRLMLHGREVQVTLRDTDEAHLLKRLEALLQHFPVEEKPESVQVPGKDWCSKHGVTMKLNHKEGRSWHSHRVNDTWCQGR